MNTAFFDAVRETVFGGKLTQAQVNGMNALLDAGKRYGLADAHHMANVLAQVAHETGTYMCPIKETVMPYHTDKNPSDATVISRLDTAFAKGQLPWVKKPYWRDGGVRRCIDCWLRRMGLGRDRPKVGRWAVEGEARVFGGHCEPRRPDHIRTHDGRRANTMANRTAFSIYLWSQERHRIIPRLG